MGAEDRDLGDRQWAHLTESWSLAVIRPKKDRAILRSAIRTHLEAVKRTTAYRARWDDLVSRYGDDHVMAVIRGMELASSVEPFGDHSEAIESDRGVDVQDDLNQDRPAGALASEPGELNLELTLLAGAFEVPVTRPLNPYDPNDPKYPKGVDRVVGAAASPPLWALSLLGLATGGDVPDPSNPRWDVTLDLSKPTENLLDAVRLLHRWFDRLHGIKSHSRKKSGRAWDDDFGYEAAFELLHHRTTGGKPPQYRVLESRLAKKHGHKNEHIRKAATILLKEARARVEEEERRLAPAPGQQEHAEALKHELRDAPKGSLSVQTVVLLLERYPWASSSLHGP